MSSRAPGYTPPSMIETIRMNLTVLETAAKKGDTGTAKKCVDTAEELFKGLRAVLGGKGVDVGPSIWRAPSTPEDTYNRAILALARIDRTESSEKCVPEPQPPAPVPALPPPAAGPGTAELEIVLRRVLADQRRELLPPPPAGWLVALERREWSFAILGRLAWLWVCCAATLGWRGVRRVFRGARRSR